MSNTELRGAIHVLQGLLTEAVSVINTIEPESTEEKAMLDALVDRMCAAATPFCQQAQPAQQEPLGYLPKWAFDRLTGDMGSVSDPLTWGLYTHVYKKPVEHAVAIYTAPEKGGA